MSKQKHTPSDKIRSDDIINALIDMSAESDDNSSYISTSEDIDSDKDPEYAPPTHAARNKKFKILPATKLPGPSEISAAISSDDLDSDFDFSSEPIRKPQQKRKNQQQTHGAQKKKKDNEHRIQIEEENAMDSEQRNDDQQVERELELLKRTG